MFKTVDIEKFETFIGQVEANGVSSADVLSFESLIGSNFITKDLKPNRFSWERSRINADTVITRAREVIDNINTEATKYTVLDVCNLSKTLSRKLDNLLNTLSLLNRSLNSEANIETLERMFNEKYTLWYRDENLVNVAEDENIIEAFSWNRNYLQAMVNDKYACDRILNLCEELRENNRNMLDYSPLLNVLAGNGFNYVHSQRTVDTSFTFRLTIRNLIDFINKFDSDHKEKIEWTLNRVTDMKNSYEKKARVFEIYDYREITTVYSNLQTIEALLDDKLGNGIIDILNYLLRK